MAEITYKVLLKRPFLPTKTMTVKEIMKQWFTPQVTQRLNLIVIGGNQGFLNRSKAVPGLNSRCSKIIIIKLQSTSIGHDLRDSCTKLRRQIHTRRTKCI